MPPPWPTVEVGFFRGDFAITEDPLAVALPRFWLFYPFWVTLDVPKFIELSAPPPSAILWASSNLLIKS
jgi:hypothetical protein